MDNDRMFDEDSFSDLKSADEIKAAVAYLAHNELKFRAELASEGLDYDEIQKIVGQVWSNLLELCRKHKYSDYIVDSKKHIYK